MTGKLLEALKPRALILGIGGQDGSYMAELLLSTGYEVHGMMRRSSYDNLARIGHILDKVHLHRGDLGDGGSVDRIIRDVNPREIYNLADQDHVGASYDAPGYSLDVTAGAVGRLLESVRIFNKGIRVFQPVTALMFGNAPPPQNETTPLNPINPYAIAKTAAYHLARFYRKHYGLFVATGILFNHDSPRRGPDYLLQKICAHAICRKERRLGCGSPPPKLPVGSLEAKLDIGFAGDYVKAIHRITLLDTPDDFVVGSALRWVTKVRDLIRHAYAAAGVSYGRIEDEVVEKPELMRGEVLLADTQKLDRATGWYPETNIQMLTEMIVGKYQGVRV